MSLGFQRHRACGCAHRRRPSSNLNTLVSGHGQSIQVVQRADGVQVALVDAGRTVSLWTGWQPITGMPGVLYTDGRLWQVEIDDVLLPVPREVARHVQRQEGRSRMPNIRILARDGPESSGLCPWTSRCARQPPPSSSLDRQIHFRAGSPPAIATEPSKQLHC